MDKVHEWLEISLKNLIHHEKFKNTTRIKDLKVKRLEDEMVVFVSDTYRCNIILEKEGGETQEVQAIAKFEPDGPVFLNLIKKMGFFETEIMMYEKTLKTMESLMIENGDEEELLWPECYFCNDNKLLIHDLNELGYRDVPTHKYLSLDHISLVMEAIGKFHGMSMVLVEKKRLDAQGFRKTLLTQKVPFIVNMYTGGITTLAQVVKNHWKEPQWSSVAERLMKAVENVGDKLVDMYEASLGKFDIQVLNHGDFSIKNLLFQYKSDSEVPIAVKLIDFQACHFSLPARDIAMILYTSVMPQLREENLDILLEKYTASLEKTCRRFGYGEQVPSLDYITSSVRSFSYWTSLISLCSLPVFLSSYMQDYKLEVEKFVEADSDKNEGKPKGAVNKAYYRIKVIEEALKFEVQRCMNQNII